MGGAWPKLIALILKLLAVLGLYGKGRIDANKNARLKGQKAKIAALEIKDEVDEMSDADVAASLSEWVRPPK